MKKKTKTKKTKYRYIDAVGTDIRIYPCEHEKVDYKA